MSEKLKQLGFSRLAPEVISRNEERMVNDIHNVHFSEKYSLVFHNFWEIGIIKEELLNLGPELILRGQN